MKILLAFIILIGLQTQLPAQNIAVSADKMNIAYIGVDNPLSIVSDNCSCKDIFATTDNGELTKGDSCHFSYRPASPGKATIVIQKKQNGKLVKIGEQALRCKRVLDAHASVGGKSSGLVSLNEFKVQQGVSVSFDPGFEMDLKFAVTSFKISLFYKSSEYSEDIYGNRFTPATIAHINLLKPGDRVLIENITALGPPKYCPRRYNPIVLTMR